MTCNSGQGGEHKTLFLCGICNPVQRSATPDRTLVAGAGVSGSSPLVGSPGICINKPNILCKARRCPFPLRLGMPKDGSRTATMAPEINTHELLCQTSCSRTARLVALRDILVT